MSAPQPKAPAYSRSRLTVVCTECKRLKIKCDRQTPCSGCAKRSNDPRVCVYLTANTERPDIGVLWNNQRESDLKIDSLAVRVDEIQDAFLPRKIVVPTLVIVSTGKGPLTMFPLDPITALWTTVLGIPIARVDSLTTGQSSSQSQSTPTSSLFVADEPLHLIAAFYDADAQLPKQPLIRPRALITPAILNNLPGPISIEPLLSSLNSILILHPVCSFRGLETRLRALDGRGSAACTVAHFALAAASMTLASLAYQAERRAWKLQFDVPENERDITKLFDLARLAIRLAGEDEEDQNDVMLALLFLVVFALHSLELDGHAAVASGVVPSHIHLQLGQLLDLLRRKSVNRSLLMEGAHNPNQSLYAREQRRMLAGAVAYYDFHVEDLISNKITIDNASYTTESPATFDDLLFNSTSTTIPPPPSGNNTNRSSLFATQRSKILKNLLQARTEVVFGRDQERDLMIQAAEHALNKKPVDDKVPARITPLSSPAGDILHMWDDRLNQQRENLPRPMMFNTSPEYAADIGIVFANEQRPMGVYEPSMTLSMGYTIAQQTEIAGVAAYYRMRLAVLLLENTLVYKPRGSPPHSTMNTAIVKALEATQDLVAAIRVQRHVLKKKMPLALSNYAFGKRIFDAGVVFGVLASIGDLRNQPRTTTRDAAEGLAQCIELLKDLEAWLRIKDGVSEQQQQQQQAGQDMHASSQSPPLRILEELAERAGVRIEDGMVEIVQPRRKRGTYELEENDESWDGLILAYIMGGWVVGAKARGTAAHTSWIGQPEVIGSPEPTGPRAGSFPTLVPSEASAEEHRSKRACRHPTDAMARGMDGVVSSGDEYEDPKARRTSDGSSSNTGRPGSGRPVLAVRARVAEKRPKRKPNPANGGLPSTQHQHQHQQQHQQQQMMKGGKKVKSESPMDSIEEDFEDRFAFNVNKQPDAEYSYALYPQQTQGHSQAPQPQQQQQQQQHSSVAAASQQQSLSGGESGSSNESPCTPHVPHLQGYVADPWVESEGPMLYSGHAHAHGGHASHAAHGGQQMMQGQMYNPSVGLTLSQPPEPAYMHPQHSSQHHHAPAQPQVHHHHQAHQQQQQQQQGQQQPHGRGHGQPAPQHMSYRQQQQQQQEYQNLALHSGHLHYPPPPPQAYSGYANGLVENASRSHPQLVIDPHASLAVAVAAAANSQPSSAVTMGEPNAFYQGIPPSAVYAQQAPPPPQQQQQQQQQQAQDQYSQGGWRPQEFYGAY